jgi:hypothetical protein
MDCGATREEIDDDIFPVCQKAEGPNRLAIIHTRRALWHFEAEGRDLQRRFKSLEEMIPEMHRALRENREKQAEVRASLELLQGPSDTTLSLHEAISRT